MKQSRVMSLVEAVANLVVGYGVAVVTQILIFPVFGLHTMIFCLLGSCFGLMIWNIGLLLSVRIRSGVAAYEAILFAEGSDWFWWFNVKNTVK